MQTMRWVKSELSSRFNGCSCLQDIIGVLEQELFAQGEVICEIRLNDQSLSEEQERHLGTAGLEEIESLEVFSQKTHELISQSIQSVINWIPQVQMLAEKSAENFRSGNDEEARKLFKEVLESCEWLTEALKLLLPEFVKISEDSEFETRWEESERFYYNGIQELFEAYENKDFMLVADVLEYEVTSALDNWLELIQKDGRIMSIIQIK